MCQRQREEFQQLMAQKVRTLRVLGGVHCGRMDNVEFERVPDGYLLVVSDVDMGILLNMDILIRLNSRN